MDGDEEQWSAAVAVCDGATGDGAEKSGDAAPSVAEAEPRAAGSAVADPADPAEVDAATDDATEEAAPDDTSGESADAEGDADAEGENDGLAAVGAGDGGATDDAEIAEADDAEADDAADVAAVAVGEEQPGSAARRLGPYLRRGVVALVAVGVGALAVSAFAWVVPSLEGANRQFIEEAQSHGHAIAPGEQEMLVLSAARKICDRKVTHDTVRERRSTALTSAELAAVGAVFGPRTRDFTALALDTYCR